VSSSGHLILVPWLFNWEFLLAHPELNKTFDVALHIGTFLGAAAFFWRDIVTYTRGFVRSVAHRRVETTEERLAWLILLGTVPAVITGLLLQDVIERHLGQPWLIAVMLALFGAVLIVVDKVAKQTRRLGDLRGRDALVIGVAQALALQPGVSRSGVTITAARGLSMEREDAVRFSFLLSLPVIAGAGMLKLVPLIGDGIPAGMGSAFFWGVLASAVSGYLVVWLLLAIVRRFSLAAFVVYRFVVAALVFGLIATNTRPAGGL
jgi:undecaprenyl-diphosphatase